MKKILMMICLGLSVSAFAQLDKDQLALDIYKAEEANTQKLKEFIWKRKSNVSVDGALKVTTLTEFSFDTQGALQTKMIDAETTVKKKPGLRGKAQQNAVEDKMDYVEKALGLAMSYTFMTKGQLLDFFGKATLTEKDGIIEASGENVLAAGDKLVVHVNSKTKLFIDKKFSSLLGKDPVDGEMKFETFTTGTNHGSTTVLNMPAQKMKIESVNQDYTTRMK